MKRFLSIFNALRLDELVRHTAVLFSGMMLVNVCNLVFQMAVSRALSGPEYTLLAAFLGVLAMISYPLSTLSTALSRYSSLLGLQGRFGDVRRLLFKWLFLSGVPAVLLGAGVLLFSEPLAGMLHLDRRAPVLIAGALLPALFWFPVLAGAAQGLQLFGWSSVSSVAGALGRLVLGAGLVCFWVPACGWAMLGHGAGLYLSLAVLLPGLIRRVGRYSSSGKPLPSLRFYLVQSFFLQAAFAVLMNADVVLVKHFLPSETDFAYAGMLGRIVAFLPAAVPMAMFPKVASEGEFNAGHRRIFGRAFLITALFVASAAAGCWLMPRLLLRILFGIREASDSLVALSRIMALAMSASALLNTVVQLLLAQRRFRESAAVVAAGGGYLLSAALFHRDPAQIAIAAGICNAVALFVVLAAVLRIRPERPS